MVLGKVGDRFTSWEDLKRSMMLRLSEQVRWSLRLLHLVGDQLSAFTRLYQHYVALTTTTYDDLTETSPLLFSKVFYGSYLFVTTFFFFLQNKLRTTSNCEILRQAAWDGRTARQHLWRDSFKDIVLLVLHGFPVFVEDCRSFLSQTSLRFSSGLLPSLTEGRDGVTGVSPRRAKHARTVFPRARRHGLHPAERLLLVAVETDLPRAVSVRAGCAWSRGSGHL